MLFSGRFAEARTCFEEAVEQGGPAVATEALLKSDVCEWLIDRHGARATRARSAAMAMDRNHLDVQIEDQVLRAVDPIDWEAHWALAAEHMREQRYADALPHFLICAFITAGNRDTWTNALLCALGMRDVAMSQAVLRCTLAMGGPTMADDYFERISVTSEIAEGLSAVIAEFNEEFSAEHPSGVTLRILQSDHEEEL